jgi:hypothetical protein
MTVNNNLLGGFEPYPNLKNDGVSSSVGMMTFTTEWNNNPNVPNHQPGNDLQILDLPKKCEFAGVCITVGG